MALFVELEFHFESPGIRPFDEPSGPMRRYPSGIAPIKKPQRMPRLEFWV
jgi:hypothetical protein